MRCFSERSKERPLRICEDINRFAAVERDDPGAPQNGPMWASAPTNSGYERKQKKVLHLKSTPSLRTIPQDGVAIRNPFWREQAPALQVCED